MRRRPRSWARSRSAAAPATSRTGRTASGSPTKARARSRAFRSASQYAAAVDRVVLVAPLKPGVRDRAEALLTDPDGRLHEGLFRRGAVFISESEVVFLLEGDDAYETV